MPPVPYDQLRSALAYWLPYLVAASISLAAGIAALGLTFIRSRDRLLLWIGVVASLYGLRLFWVNNLVRIALGVRDILAPIEVITYLIAIPYGLFFRELLGREPQWRGWRMAIDAWVWTQLVFAPLAILAGPVLGHSKGAGIANNVLIVAGTAIALRALVAARAAAPGVLRLALLAFLVLALANNLGFRAWGRDLEPLGFLVLIGGLAHTAARRAISQEQQLAAVESELATARRIQSSILPHALPELPGLRVAAMYRPMTAVAGDFYDFLILDERRLTILVADVSGHGVPAALIASMLKVAFGLQRSHATDPSAVLTGLNGILHGVLDGQFVTAACAHIDVEGRAIVYAGAGHPPSLLIRRSGGEVLETGWCFIRMELWRPRCQMESRSGRTG